MYLNILVKMVGIEVELCEVNYILRMKIILYFRILVFWNYFCGLFLLING